MKIAANSRPRENERHCPIYDLSIAIAHLYTVTHSHARECICIYTCTAFADSVLNSFSLSLSRSLRRPPAIHFSIRLIIFLDLRDCKVMYTRAIVSRLLFASFLLSTERKTLKLVFLKFRSFSNTRRIT